MPFSAETDRFRLAYDRTGSGPPVLLLHGWPGDRHDYRALVPLLDGFDVVVPDLRGFGESDKHPAEPETGYSAAAQAASVTALLTELSLDGVVVAGYDIGSRIAQTLAAAQPALVRHLVVAPPLPGIGARILDAAAQREFWYQSFHQLALAQELLDGQPGAVRDYLAHFWRHWSGPEFTLDGADLDRLAAVYGAPGAFTASIGWYRAGAGSVARSLAEQPPAAADRLAVPATVLWPEHDPLFPPAWADRLDEFFAAATLQLMPGVGHFSPLEGPQAFATAIRAAAG